MLSKVGSRRGRARLGRAALAMAAFSMVGCGSGSGGGVGGAGHDSPEGAVRGFVAALTAWDGTSAGLGAVAAWVAPSERLDFTSGFTALTATGGSVKISFRVDNFDVASVDTVSADRAVVHVKGTGSFCFSGNIAGVSTSVCTTAPLSPSTTSDSVATVAVGGQWYVDTAAGSGGFATSSSASTSLTAPASASG